MNVGRALVGLVLATGSLLAAAAPAAAETPTGRWTSPEPTGQVDGVPSIVVDGPVRLRGSAEHAGPIAAVSFRVTRDDPDVACSALASTPPQSQPGGGSRVEFAFDASFPCNRRYQVEAVVEPAERPLREDQPLRLPLWVSVAVPPAPVTGLVAEQVAAPGRGTNLRWDAADREPDFLGYEVRRASGGGAFRPIGEAGAAETGFTDLEVPAGGGRFRYQVVGMRPSPDGEGTVYGKPVTAELEVPPAVPDEPGRGPVAGGGGSSSSGSTAPGTAAPRVTGTYRPPSGGGFRTPTTLDTGFQETLPFSPREQLAAAPPRGDAAVVARLEEDGDETARQNMLLVAGGGVTLSWALVLRLLVRRAAPLL